MKIVFAMMLLKRCNKCDTFLIEYNAFKLQFRFKIVENVTVT